MCAQGVNWKTAQPYTTQAKNNSETFVFGCQNDTIAGEKTEIVSPLWLVGVLGLKAEVVVGAQVGWVEGYKYDRVPLGQVEVIGDHWGGHGSHTTSVGTSFFVGAGESAKIQSPDLTLTATAEVSAPVAAVYPMIMTKTGLQQGPVPITPAAAAVNNTTTLQLLTTQATLTAGANETIQQATTAASLTLNQTQAQLTGFSKTGVTPSNAVTINADSLSCQHATAANIGTSNTNCLTANNLGVTISGAPAVILNGTAEGVSINGSLIKLGQPVVTSANFSLAALTAAQNAQAAARAAFQAQLAVKP
jgi:hypothetical protein